MPSAESRTGMASAFDRKNRGVCSTRERPAWMSLFLEKNLAKEG